MKIVFGLCLAMLVALCQTVSVLAADASEEDQLIGVLQSAATPQAKDAACVRLKRIGTARSVPALASLLPDAQLSHSARLALESMPAPEAGQALVEALDKTTSLTQEGIIQSVGLRRDAKAIPALARLVASPDPGISCAAAAALGEIGGPDAVKSLRSAFPAAAEPARTALVKGLLAAAGRLLADGDVKGAYFLYERIYMKSDSDPIRSAAYLGMIRSSSDKALRLVLDGLRKGDGPAQAAALKMASSVEDPDATKALCKVLPKLSPAAQIALIEGLAQRGDPAASRAMVDAADSSDPAVRIAAITAQGSLGDPKAVACLAKAVTSSDPDEKKAAQQALIDLHRGDVRSTIVAQLALGKGSVPAEMARVLVGRGEVDAVPKLMDLARGGPEGCRSAAYYALSQLATSASIPGLVQLVLSVSDDPSRAQAAKTLASVCRRLQERGEAIDATPFASAMATGDVPARAALIRASGSLADERIRLALRGALAGPDADLRQAAVEALTQTRDPQLMADQLALAKDDPTTSTRITALRGYLKLATDETTTHTASQRLEAIKQALPLVQRTEEKWLVLSGLGGLATAEAYPVIFGMLGDPATQAEAARAIVQLAAKTLDSNPETAREALKKAMSACPDPKLHEESQALLKRIDENQIRAHSGKEPKSAPTSVRFRRQQLDPAFRSEGVAVADFNRDGKLDIATGTMLYWGPDWKPQPMQGEPRQYDPENYSNEFLCFDEDIDRDGWLDLIVVGFPGAKTRWMKNPGPSGGAWTEFTAIEKTGNESPAWTDVDKDGRKELVFMSENGLAFARPGANPTQPWPLEAIAGPADPQPGHGLGVGDVNGDGRNDIVCPDGWWEAPATPKRTPWPFHASKLSEFPAQMIVLDVNGDGRSDILSSSAHGYGFWWYEQTFGDWQPHEIDKCISELHALEMADINRDGQPDLVTGKRFWAHRHESGVEEPAVLCWYEFQRKDGQVTWLRHDIDFDSGVGLHFQVLDVNGDGLLDIVTSNKKGVYLFTQESGK